MGRLCATDSARIASSDDLTAEQIVAATVDAPSAYLIDQWGRSHPLSTNTTVGRVLDEGNFAILHHTISSMHAQISKRDDDWQLIDRGSLNGTLHNGARIRAGSISSGDVIGFGDVSFFFAEKSEDTSPAVSGPGRTLPSKQESLGFSAVLVNDTMTLHLAERPGGGILKIKDGKTLEFARLEFALLVALGERRQQARDPDLAYVSSRELAKSLSFRSHDADTDNVRELIRRVRKKLQAQGIDDLIESRQGVGYRIGWPFEA